MRRVVVLLLLTAVVQHGCAALAPSPATEYDLTFRPVVGMRLAYDVTVQGSAAGEQLRQSLTKVITIVSADTDAYSVRLAFNGTEAPYLVTLTWTGAVKSVTPDGPGNPSPTTEQLAAAATLSSWMKSGASTGPWRIGVTREVVVQIPDGDAKGSELTLRARLRRITSFARRLAAEMTLDGVGTITGSGAPIVMRMSGTLWTDIRTGAPLLSTMTGDGQATVGGNAFRVEMKVEERLNIPASERL